MNYNSDQYNKVQQLTLLGRLMKTSLEVRISYFN